MKAQRRTGVNGERVNCRVQLIRVVPPKLSVPFGGKEGFGVFVIQKFFPIVEDGARALEKRRHFYGKGKEIS